MKRPRSFPLAIGFLIGVTGCASFMAKAKPSILPSYIHKLAIRPFANHTQQYGLEDKLTLAVQSEFNRDSRYQITDEGQGDGVVIGDIIKYILEPLSYDANHVPTQYKLSIYVNLSFLDKVKGEEMWKEPNMLGELRYYVTSSGLPGSMTEEDARQTIFDQLSRDIRTRTIEGFGGGEGHDRENTNADLRQLSPADNLPPAVPNPEPPAPSPTKLPY